LTEVAAVDAGGEDLGALSSPSPTKASDDPSGEAANRLKLPVASDRMMSLDNGLISRVVKSIM
jgi:hypothetical protein